MTRSIRLLSVIWLILGACLAALGVLAVIEEPIHKFGKVWMVPLLPAVTFATSWGAMALGIGLSKGNSAQVALLGRIMSVPCFALAIGLILLGGVGALLGDWSLHTAACFAGGAAVLGFSGYTYRVAQRADSWEPSSLSLF